MKTMVQARGVHVVELNRSDRCSRLRTAAPAFSHVYSSWSVTDCGRPVFSGMLWRLRLRMRFALSSASA